MTDGCIELVDESEVRFYEHALEDTLYLARVGDFQSIANGRGVEAAVDTVAAEHLDLVQRRQAATEDFPVEIELSDAATANVVAAALYRTMRQHIKLYNKAPGGVSESVAESMAEWDDDDVRALRHQTDALLERVEDAIAAPVELPEVTWPNEDGDSA
jgi:hypothetical protein